MVIRDTDTQALEEFLTILKEQAGRGMNQRLSQSVHIKIRAREMTLTERAEGDRK